MAEGPLYASNVEKAVERKYHVVDRSAYQPVEWSSDPTADNEIGPRDTRAFFEAACRHYSYAHKYVTVVALPVGEGVTSAWTEKEFRKVVEWVSDSDNCPSQLEREELRAVEPKKIDVAALQQCSEDEQCAKYSSHLYMPAVGAARDRAVTMAQMNHHYASVYLTTLRTDAERWKQKQRGAAIAKNFNRVMDVIAREHETAVVRELERGELASGAKASETKAWTTRAAENRRVQQQTVQAALAGQDVDAVQMASMSAHVIAPQFAQTETELSLCIHDSRHASRGQGEKSNMGSACRVSVAEKKRRNDLCGQEMMLSIAYLGRNNAMLCALGEMEGCIEEPADAPKRYEDAREGKEVQLTDYRVPGIVTMHDTAGNIMQVNKWGEGETQRFDSVVVRDVAALLEYIHSFAMEQGKEYQLIRAGCGAP